MSTRSLFITGRRGVGMLAAAGLLAGSLCGIAAAQAVPPTSPAPMIAADSHGYDAYVCHAPATGVAVRNDDNDGAGELDRLYNGAKWHVYRTNATDPAITPGWSIGFHPVGASSVNGFFKLAYVCAGAW